FQASRGRIGNGRLRHGDWSRGARAARVDHGAHRGQSDAGGRRARIEPQHAAGQARQVQTRLNPMSAPVAQALLSVSDKSGLVEFAKALAGRGIKLLSTGGTAKALADAGLAVTDVGSYTGFPEMLDGRVKTLHPRVHGGILARRDLPEHRAALAAHDIPTIDLVVVNLYPFRETVAKPGCTLDDAIENIDIGGPSMVRAAAKNWAHVGVVVDPADYAALARELAEQGGALTDATR